MKPGPALDWTAFCFLTIIAIVIVVGQNRLKISWRARLTITVALLALPFGALGGWIWHEGVVSGNVFYYYDELGTFAYLLFGFPLTMSALWLMHPLRFDQHWWAIPMLTGLVILQWILWANLVVWTVQVLKRRAKARR
jgi:hypothetical protein